ncbi:DUF2314 domain-containing protein [Nitratireductor thuwali]|uniref:DUF2314 domain-containing protein n=1 Tax=Nitratireductor thuwali TaxID=2267699 RepID=A0ABY5MNV9_9HYPH|nr:hypothetical protein NTH_03455 [Nitratireductor thuwali]
MSRLIKIVLAILGSFAAGGGAHAEGGARPSGDNRMEYPTGDARLAEAMRKARETLPRFLQLADTGLRGAYLLKMRLAGGGRAEHIWVEVTGMRNGVFQGRLANDPVTPGYRAGDPVELSSDEIEDWMINTGEARFGGYTVRAMLGDMPAAQAEELRRQFRD